MIISELRHFEEVVCEASSIVGGATYTTSCASVLSSSLLKLLPASFRDLLSKTQCTVTTITAQSGGAFASATTAVSSNKGKVNIGVSVSSSSSSSSSKGASSSSSSSKVAI